MAEGPHREKLCARVSAVGESEAAAAGAFGDCLPIGCGNRRAHTLSGDADKLWEYDNGNESVDCASMASPQAHDGGNPLQGFTALCLSAVSSVISLSLSTRYLSVLLRVV